MKAANSTYSIHSDGVQDHDDDHWESAPLQRNRRSYEMLSDAFSTLFEDVYLRNAALQPKAPAGEMYFNQGLYESLRSHYVTIRKSDETTGQLDVEICPANASGAAQPFIYAAPEMRAAISAFLGELIECGAGIPGVEVDSQRLAVSVPNPEAFYEVIKSVCAARQIISAEALHDAHVAKADAYNEGHQKPGHYNYMPKDKQRPGEAEDMKAGMQYRGSRASGEGAADIPERVFASMAMQPYGYQGIGRLINDFNLRASYALLSLEALEAAVKQDREGKAYLPGNPVFNIH